MRTKLCVLGAVLGTASVLPGVCLTSVEPPTRTKQGQARSGGARLPHGPGEGRELLPRVPASAPASTPPGAGPEGPKHPCELITVMRVPCDSATATCEYTYWECPRHVNPLRA